MQKRSARPLGFTITEMAVVLVIIGLLFVFLLPVSNTLLSNQRRSATLQTLQNIQAALNNFAIINKRLPCPADGSLAIPSGLEGPLTANGDCANNQADGIVPWVPLGLAPAATLDAWYDQITYRVGYGLTRTGALDMTYCDPGGAAAVTAAWPAAGVPAAGRAFARQPVPAHFPQRTARPLRIFWRTKASMSPPMEPPRLWITRSTPERLTS